MYDKELKERFNGIGALVLTCFDEDLQLNLDGLKKNVRHMINNGINASNGFLIANGSTGECYAMNIQERKQVIKATIEAANNEVPVMAGCNDTNVFNVIELANYSKQVGANAVMIVQPYYLPFNEEQMYSFYKFIDDNIDLPIMLYNNPVIASQSDMSINLIKRLAKLEHVFALKETTPNIKRFFHTQVLTKELLVFAGSSSLQPFGAIAGMSGFISFISSFNPQLQVKLWDAIRKEDYKEAQKFHSQELSLYDWWWSGNIKQTFGQVVHAKKAMDLMGLEGGYSRPPLLPIKEEQIEGLKNILREWKLL
jgi:dihydrodipicolinate synthase/N-acetylneuraminate lyase